jgi:hypothetical protein
MCYDSLKYSGRSSLSTSFPLPFAMLVFGGTGEGVEGMDDEFMLFSWGVLLPNCHAGIEGLPNRGRDDTGALDVAGRLRSKAFKDLSSCCNSFRDWF